MADPDPPGPPPGSLCREIALGKGYRGKDSWTQPKSVDQGEEGVQEGGDLLTPGPNQRG